MLDRYCAENVSTLFCIGPNLSNLKLALLYSCIECRIIWICFLSNRLIVLKTCTRLSTLIVNLTLALFIVPYFDSFQVKLAVWRAHMPCYYERRASTSLYKNLGSKCLGCAVARMATKMARSS